MRKYLPSLNPTGLGVPLWWLKYLFIGTLEGKCCRNKEIAFDLEPQVSVTCITMPAFGRSCGNRRNIWS